MRIISTQKNSSLSNITVLVSQIQSFRVHSLHTNFQRQKSRLVNGVWIDRVFYLIAATGAETLIELNEKARHLKVSLSN
jgi:hypothetical protein